MSLYFALRVNSRSIGFFEATRTSGVDQPGTVNRYAVTVTRYATKLTRPVSVTFDITHDYGDGAFALVAKALDFANPELDRKESE